MHIIQDLIPASARNRPGIKQTPRKIVVHETANTSRGANAAMHGRYVRGQDARNRSVSWHYSVDEAEIRQHLPDTERGWHAGSGNVDSIGIELCVNIDGNWAQTKRKGQQLIAFLIKNWGISLIEVTTHQQETGKNCPANLLREGFAAFKAGIGVLEQVKSETIEDEEVYVMLDADFASNNKAIEDVVRRYGVSDMEGKLKEGKLKQSDLFGTLAKAAMANGSSRRNPSDAHAGSVKKAEDKGVMSGRPGEYLTREQLASVLDRTGNLD
ncbi:N-acetylmuramoyl-L-alanine amidase family protein [Geomicrobium sp. JCM 19039]|uniref:peptidoglycan recognition protein family protein n=1 Tax=Geomicrobium sp. JCM 19039 TaxID=1460636 RepID=UPI00045F4A26|nr:N-acetylmuramoyl-L-alanine amidase [Geomicrobium sp. JCM 19039]GAK11416.1 N-acetylmuramoyl-L-alanine amidase CwlH precursor [Geomicrobium sp. JCM 19039]